MVYCVHEPRKLRVQSCPFDECESIVGLVSIDDHEYDRRGFALVRKCGHCGRLRVYPPIAEFHANFEPEGQVGASLRGAHCI